MATHFAVEVAVAGQKLGRIVHCFQNLLPERSGLGIGRVTARLGSRSLRRDGTGVMRLCRARMPLEGLLYRQSRPRCQGAETRCRLGKALLCRPAGRGGRSGRATKARRELLPVLELVLVLVLVVAKACVVCGAASIA